MPVKIAVLLVHGIGAQKVGSVEAAWRPPIETEVQEILKEQSRSQNDVELTFAEYPWDPEVKAFSGLAVTTWSLINLPRIVAIHTALSYRGRGAKVDNIDTVEGVYTSGKLRVWNLMLRGFLAPIAISVLVCFLWIINPPIVLLTGMLSMVQFWKWGEGRPPWKPIRPANFVMARIVGDAFMWLASPAGRIFSRGSQSTLVEGFTDKLEELCATQSKVVVIAHSQGAAIAVQALKKWNPKTHDQIRLITVGGGHRLLIGIEDSLAWFVPSGNQTIARKTLLWSAAYTAFSVVILAEVFKFFFFYAGAVLLWFGLTPLWFTSNTLSWLTGGIYTLSGDSWWELLMGLLGRLLEVTSSVMSVVVFTCAIAVSCATAEFGRPVRAGLPTLPCDWIEVWSRFDPVCIGPPLEAVSMSMEEQLIVPKRSKEPVSIETWILRSGMPLLEHTSYFLPGSSSLRAVAMGITWFANSLDVQVKVPAIGDKTTLGLRWIKITKGALIVWCFILLSLGTLLALWLFSVVR